jgi:hypothetical protein
MRASLPRPCTSTLNSAHASGKPGTQPMRKTHFSILSREQSPSTLMSSVLKITEPQEEFTHAQARETDSLASADVSADGMGRKGQEIMQQSAGVGTRRDQVLEYKNPCIHSARIKTKHDAASFYVPPLHACCISCPHSCTPSAIPTTCR